MNNCSVNGCEKAKRARGYCSAHWARWKKNGDPGGPIKTTYRTGCDIDGCKGKHLSRGYCGKHYQALARHGQPVIECQVKGHWTDKETALLCEVYENLTNNEIQRIHFPLRKVDSIRYKAEKLGLNKSKEHKSAVYASIATGRTPWNKKSQDSVVCAICLNQFYRHESYLSTVKTAHCSKSCADEARRRVKGYDHPLYTRQKRVCKWCGGQFMAKAAKVRYGEAKFCSRSCGGSYSIRKQGGRRSSLEVVIEKCLDFLGIDYVPQQKLGKFNVDFYLPGLNLIIECDGEYWHSLEKQKNRDKRKDKWAADNKIKMARIKEPDIRNSPMASLVAALEMSGSTGGGVNYEHS